MSDLIEVRTTTATKEEAMRIASALLDARLAACVQTHGPVHSQYFWNGAIEVAEEWVCSAKTVAGLYHNVEAEIRRNHPYDEPQVIATAIVAGSASYVAWVKKQVKTEER